MEGEGEKEHERAERGMSLKVHVNVVAAALQVRARAVAVTVTISSFRNEGGSLVLSSSHLLKVQNNPLQYEDCKEASSHDELWKRETGLFETTIKRLFHFKICHHFPFEGQKKQDHDYPNLSPHGHTSNFRLSSSTLMSDR